MDRATIRVLVVDDHTVVRKGLCALLSSPRYTIEVIGEAGDGAQAIMQAGALHPDVILMDLLMPIKTGVEALQDIRAEDPDAKALILTSADDRTQVIAALKAGARGYILKKRPARRSTILARSSAPVVPGVDHQEAEGVLSAS